MKKWYRNMAIYKKISISFVGILILFISLVLVMSNSILYRSNVKKIRQSIQDESRMLNDRLNSMYDNMRLCQNSTIQGINQIYKEAQPDEVNEISFVSIKNSLEYVLRYYEDLFQDVDSMVFLDEAGNVTSAGLEKNVENLESLQKLSEQIPAFGPVRSITFPVGSYEAFGEDPVFSIGIRVIRIDTGENLGDLFINLRTSSIESFFPEGEENSYSRKYELVDEQGRVVISRDPAMLFISLDEEYMQQLEEHNEESFEKTFSGERYLITSWKNDSLGYRLVSKIRMSEILRDIRIMSAVILLIGLLSIGVAVLVVLVLAGVITKPIQALTDTAQRIADGDLSQRCVVQSQDEVGILAKTFNRMLERIEALLEQIRSEQKEKREAELALFQLQIKPHFLYNTLEQIYMCCQLEETEAGGKITKALADFYRTALSGGEEVISIQEEIRNIENYLLIQQERYSDILQYEIHAKKELLGYRIPKMTLQPLVENAIYHGLKEKGTQGMIQIDVEESGENLLLSIRDDGVGMKPERFREILNQESGRKAHFGVKNVHERIKLYFGKEYGLSLDEAAKDGTGILITIPKVEVYHDKSIDCG